MKEDDLSKLVRIRRAMALRGWQSEDRLSTQGWGDNVGYTIWFSRWNWHGNNLLGNSATYWASGYVSEGILQIVEKAASRAKLAWRAFSDFPPEQLSNGKLRESVFKEIARKSL